MMHTAPDRVGVRTRDVELPPGMDAARVFSVELQGTWFNGACFRIFGATGAMLLARGVPRHYREDCRVQAFRMGAAAFSVRLSDLRAWVRDAPWEPALRERPDGLYDYLADGALIGSCVYDRRFLVPLLAGIQGDRLLVHPGCIELPRPLVLRPPSDAWRIAVMPTRAAPMCWLPHGIREAA